MPRYALAFATLIPLALSAQDPLPTFDAVSVKPATRGPGKITSDPGRITMTAQALDVLIRLAYSLREYQYEGPSWAHVTRYDVVATTATPQSRAVELAMLRAVLADRFRLAVRHESKTMPVYALVVARNGPKLKPIDAKAPTPFDLYANIGIEQVPGGASAFHSLGSLALLCDFLTRLAGRPVVDATGISGVFDFRLLCAIDGYPGEDTSPTVFDALPAQMGLRLEARNAPVDVTIVDRLEKPVEN